MKKSRVFEIAWVGLKEGQHTYEYEINDRFLSDLDYAGDDMHNLDCRVRLTFDKKVNFFQLHFDIDGKATVACDRCGDPVELVLWDEFDLLVKLTNDESLVENEEEDVVFIPFNETIIDVSEWIYEFLLLSLPIQRIHSVDEAGKSLCNPDVIALLDKYKNDIAEQQQNKLWKGLENFKKDDN